LKESNLGLYEERLSAIEKNRAMSLKERQAALTSLLENIARFGEIETSHQQIKLDQENQRLMMEEEWEKRDVERRTESNKFLEQIMGGMQAGTNNQQARQPEMAAMSQQGM
jgi:hypothetical protein